MSPVPYSSIPERTIEHKGKTIAYFPASEAQSSEVIHSFSAEWSKFSRFSEKEIRTAGDQYFDIVTETMLNKNCKVLDVGCGSGRWTRFAADRAGFVEGIDLIDSIHKAVDMNHEKENVRITRAGVDNIPFADESFDFIFCLGVLHHLPNTEDALAKAVKKLKRGGHFLLYVYYKMDESSLIMKLLFYLANLVRLVVCRLPDALKLPVCDLIAFFIYVPFVLLTKVIFRLTPDKPYYRNIPLYYYGDKSFRIMRNDALDRFGTRIEKRYSKKETEDLMRRAGLDHIVFSPNAPYWHAVGKK